MNLLAGQRTCPEASPAASSRESRGGRVVARTGFAHGLSWLEEKRSGVLFSRTVRGTHFGFSNFLFIFVSNGVSHFFFIAGCIFSVLILRAFCSGSSGFYLDWLGIGSRDLQLPGELWPVHNMRAPDFWKLPSPNTIVIVFEVIYIYTYIAIAVLRIWDHSRGVSPRCLELPFGAG